MFSALRSAVDGHRSVPTTAVGKTLRAATRFDRAAIEPIAGLIAVVPLTAVFGIAVALGDPVVAATLGAGAMLVAIAWRVRGGRPPVGLLALDAMLMALATLLGSATGGVLWLHLLLICIWSLGAGLLVALGQRAAMLGTQGVIAVIVFGRFSEPLPGALGLAGLVLAGGFATVLFAAVVRWPAPLRFQRASVAAVYEALAELVLAPPGASMIPVAALLDEARATLSSPMLLGDRSTLALRALVDEAGRLRIELRALQVLLARAGTPAAAVADASLPAASPPAVSRPAASPPAGSLSPTAGLASLERLGARIVAALRAIAAGVKGDARALAALANDAAHNFDLDPAAGELDPLDPPLRRRFAAIGGQLRAMTRLCEEARPGRLLDRRPRIAGWGLRRQLRSDAGRMRANATLQSPAGRHAVRLAVVVLLGELLARAIPLERSYWIVVAAATVLRPDFAATFTRGLERVLGTCAGVALAGAIAISLHPSLGVVVPIIALLGWLAFAVFPASFAVGFTFITALVVFLLDAVTTHTVATAGDRLLATLIGGALGLLAYAIWPTWSGGSARQALVEAIDAERDYLHAAASLLIGGRRPSGKQIDDEPVRGEPVGGGRAGTGDLSGTGRRARRTYASAEEAIAQALGEPTSRQAGAERSRSALIALRRVAGVVHLLRTEAQAADWDAPLAQLVPLVKALETRLGAIAASLAGGERLAAAPLSPTAAELRERYSQLKPALAGVPIGPALLDELDELVDAVNTLAETVAGR
ncbi:MAG TPA: FUSC family protein [Solirubrobacteraceae bacterium]|jgi:uncharacterized membrane protein YccC